MCSTDLRCKEQHERVNLIIEPTFTEPEAQVTMEGKKKKIKVLTLQKLSNKEGREETHFDSISSVQTEIF